MKILSTIGLTPEDHKIIQQAVSDAELSLRLGGLSQDAAPWRGPGALAESADGVILPALDAAALKGLALLGADSDSARLAGR